MNPGGLRNLLLCIASSKFAPFTRTAIHENIRPEDKPLKYLHTMVRVTDIEQSLRFYRDALGLRELSRRDYPQARYTLVLLAAPGDESAQIQLTHTWDPAAYTDGPTSGLLPLPLSDFHPPAPP